MATRLNKVLKLETKIKYGPRLEGDTCVVYH